MPQACSSDALNEVFFRAGMIFDEYFPVSTEVKCNTLYCCNIKEWYKI